MKKLILTPIILALVNVLVIGQTLNQTVRGTIRDLDSKAPLIGASIVLMDSDPIIGTIADMDGNFRLEKVPIGRISLYISSIGYEAQTIPNIEVTSGKEVVLNISLKESIVKMEEIVITASEDKGEALNDMAIVSARSISVEESKRYAGGFDDPSRIVSNFAGVSNTADGSSDIIVRGNAPKYIQWRLEGTEMSSPYHFDDQNASFGGLSALNNNLLTASDFYTGAFSPEYGNVLSAVYDVNLRNGNNESFEGIFGLGLLGTDITLEGPFKKGYAGSYLVNYRYSTSSLIGDLGLVDIGGTPKYQDATMKLVLPTYRLGTFSIFCIAGKSGWEIEDIESSMAATQTGKTKTADIREDYNKDNYLLNAGVNHLLTINNKSFLSTSFTFSGNGIADEVFESIKVRNNDGGYYEDSVINRRQNFDNSIDKSAYRASLLYSNKLNARHKIQIGAKYTLFNYDFNQSVLERETASMFTTADFKEDISTISSYISWKYRMGERLTMVTGLHNMNVMLNHKSTIEPRIAFNWAANETSILSLGYGKHSTMEGVHHYFAKVKDPDGNVTEPNKDLDLLKAHHFVLGYEKRFSENLMAKVDVYYQSLYDLPVANSDSSSFATINEGTNHTYVALVNEGKGENYGIELTVERFFDNNYYFLINGSIFNSTYTALDGVERNTRYNNNYLMNVLFGKEFRNLGKKNNRTLAVNGKIFLEGGQKYIPLLRDENGNLAVNPENNEYWDYSKAYEKSMDQIFQLNMSVSYKIDRPKTTHELFLDLQNLTNNQGKIYEYYDESEPGNVGHLKQFGFFPNLMYKVYF